MAGMRSGYGWVVKMNASVPAEDGRIEALRAYEILDTADEEAFDRIVRLARAIAEVPIAAVSMVARDRQWFKAREGLQIKETPLGISFCLHTIKNSAPFIVEDAAADPELCSNFYVLNEPHVRFYAGFPLCTGSGHNIGALCVLDTVPRALPPNQISALQDLASITIDALELRRLAACDSLTGCLTRQAFAAVTTTELGRARRSERCLSCIVLDVDHFKSINDTYGHAAGDHVLRTIASLCRGEMRAHDTLCRYGGEEFVLLLPETDETGAYVLADRIRRAVCTHHINYANCPLHVTLSGGVGSWRPSETEIDQTFVRADAALYRAKIGGRNRVARASELSEEALSKFRAA
jgi:diguanylate cyclase (GGDEF)-like protein